MSQSGPQTTTRLEYEAAHKLHFWSLPWQDRSKLCMSGMDLLLRSKWEAAIEDKVFLHRVESEPHRMHGHKGFVAMLCRNRASHKRKAQSFTNILQEADPNAFNFTKVKPAEVLFEIEDEENEQIRNNTISMSSVQTSQKTSVIINNSPYEYGHCLLVPSILECRIQSITLDAIKMGVKLLLNSSHPGFRLMYNSLCAGASINHLHLHCYYTEYWLPCEAFQMRKILPINNEAAKISDFFELDFNDTGVHGFGFVVTPENYEYRLPKMVHDIVQYFNKNNIAHNIVIIRGIPPSAAYIPHDVSVELDSSNINIEVESTHADISQNPNIPTLEQTIPYCNNEHIPANLKSSPLIGRLYIFPRVPLYGEKCYRKFLVNVTELFGHLYFGDIAVYESMDESDVIKALNDVSFTEQQFNKVKNDITELLSNF